MTWIKFRYNISVLFSNLIKIMTGKIKVEKYQELKAKNFTKTSASMQKKLNEAFSKIG